MYRRKIQLVAGTTYSVSLPKEWVKKNRLREKTEVKLFEKNDRSLVISPELLEEKELTNISLNVDDYEDNIDQVLFSIYYLGIEKINLFSKKGFSKELRSRVRKTLTHMTGTEIGYEDKDKMTINVLLDKSRVDIRQLIYRISLVLDLSIDNLMDKQDINEIKLNENEIDRLYHLAAKLVLLSLIDTKVLHSSKVGNVSLIPSYFLISKRLENLADNINDLSEYAFKNKINTKEFEKILDFVKLELARSVKHIMKDFKSIYKKISIPELEKKKREIGKVKDRTVANHLRDILRYTNNIEEEIVNISFYSKLIRDKML